MLEACWLWFVISKEYVELTRPKIKSCDPIFFTGTRSRSRFSGNDRLFPHGSEFGPNPEIPASPVIQLRPRSDKLLCPGDKLSNEWMKKTYPVPWHSKLPKRLWIPGTHKPDTKQKGRNKNVHEMKNLREQWPNAQHSLEHWEKYVKTQLNQWWGKHISGLQKANYCAWNKTHITHIRVFRRFWHLKRQRKDTRGATAAARIHTPLAHRSWVMGAAIFVWNR